MTKKNGFSKKTLYLIESVWLCFSLIITLIIKDTYHLNLWIVLCIGGPLLIMGENLIRRFIKVKE